MNDEQEGWNGQCQLQIPPFRENVSSEGQKEESERIRKVVGDGETRSILLSRVLGDEGEQRVEDARATKAKTNAPEDEKDVRWSEGGQEARDNVQNSCKAER